MFYSLVCSEQIKGTFASRHGEEVFNPYSYGSAIANYCGLVYGPLQPRYCSSSCLKCVTCVGYIYHSGFVAVHIMKFFSIDMLHL
jgi:hypothetical protein